MIVGGKKEPFLSASLDSISDAVDLAVINDNSCNPDNPNLKAIKESKLFINKKVHIIPSDFKGFGYCRTLCLDYLKSINKQTIWVLYIDADEVHPPLIKTVTRIILPCLPERIGIMDGYFYQFYQTKDYYLSLDRRHNLFFRYNPDIRWEGAVHEKPVNIKGIREALPYRYFHYGYLINPLDISEKWKMYATLGDKQNQESDSDPRIHFKKDAKRVLKFKGKHPEIAIESLQANEAKNIESIDFFLSLIQKYDRSDRLKRNFHQFNYDLRMKTRAFQFAMNSIGNRELIKGLWELLYSK